MKRLTIAQPFLFAVFPILTLLAANVDFVRPVEALIPLIAVAVATAVLLGLATWLLKDLDGAAIAISLFWFLFFFYRRLLASIGGPGGGRERLVFLGCLLLLGLTVAVAIKMRGRLGALASIVNVAGLALVAVPLLVIASSLRPRASGSSLLSSAPIAAATPTESLPGTMASAAPTATARPATDPTASATPMPAPTATPPARQPDIYYIILDGYARSDVLQELYGVDNSGFIQGLVDRGFYVAGQSRANYCQTYLSLSSTLNMTYLDALAEEVGEESNDRWPLQDLLRQNAVARLLRERGYTYATISTGYADAELAAADIHKTAPWSLSQFESGLINTSPISPLIRSQYDAHRQRLLYAFDQLPDMAALEGPLFVFAHIAAPHPPFVFDEQGGEITPNRDFTFSDGSHYMARASREEYLAGYRGQLLYVNQLVEPLIDALLARSPEPPVIILQADHGPGSQLSWESAERTAFGERMSILNAYYLPDGGDEQLYDSITPVNTFRLVLDHYLGLGLGLLEDRSYYSTWDKPYRFIPVPPE